MRPLSALLLAFAAMATVLLREAPADPEAPAPIWRSDLIPALRAGPPVSGLGPFALAGAWRMQSSGRQFGNYSALGVLRDGQLVALSDRSSILVFGRPDRPGRWTARMTPLHVPLDRSDYSWGDGESLLVLPGSGDLMLVDEGTPELFTFTETLHRIGKRTIPALREWGGNQGPEASALLADGRTVMLQEGYARAGDATLHGGFIFAGVPRDRESPQRFQINMPAGYRPTELARLPDGRLLLLGRKFTLGGFRSLVAVLDPAAIRPGALVHPRELARITDPRLRDNYEGMTVTPEPGGHIAVWMISDSNDMVVLQRTLLLKLVADPRKL